MFNKFSKLAHYWLPSLSTHTNVIKLEKVRSEIVHLDDSLFPFLWIPTHLFIVDYFPSCEFRQLFFLNIVYFLVRRGISFFRKSSDSDVHILWSSPMQYSSYSVLSTSLCGLSEKAVSYMKISMRNNIIHEDMSAQRAQWNNLWRYQCIMISFMKIPVRLKVSLYKTKQKQRWVHSWGAHCTLPQVELFSYSLRKCNSSW